MAWHDVICLLRSRQGVFGSVLVPLVFSGSSPGRDQKPFFRFSAQWALTAASDNKVRAESRQ